MQDCVLLPQSTQVTAFVQTVIPRGWMAQMARNSNFPHWCGRSTLVAMKLPSHFKNNRLPSNMHNIVLLFSEQTSTHNAFTGTMQHLFGSWCSCKMGSRTNSFCAHRSGAMIALMSSWFFKSKVTPMFKVIDIWRHPNFQPISTGGVPTGNRDRSQLVHAYPCRPRKSDDSRAVMNRRFEATFIPSISQTSGTLLQSHASTQANNASSIQLVPTPVSYSCVNHTSGLGGLLNANNCCYINSVVQGLISVSIQDNINWLDNRLLHQPELLELCETFYDICIRRRNASTPPFAILGSSIKRQYEHSY